jgi:hypothetical protein
VAVLLLLDWTLFDAPAMAARLPIGNNDGSPSDKLLLAARYRDAEVLYLGDSRVFYGVDPSIVSEACGCGPGFNGAVPAADPSLTSVMADRLLQKLSPRLVVLGVSQWELSDDADIPVDDPAREVVAPGQLPEFGVTLDWPEQIEARTGTAWRLYKYRGELRSALDAWASGAGPEDPRRGFEVYRERRRIRQEDFERRERQWFRHFSVDGRRTEALRGLVGRLRRRGIQVLLVAPPLHPDFYAEVRREVAMFRAAVQDLAAEEGAAFEDVTDAPRIGLTADDFLDVAHLNEAGAATFSRHLGNVLRSRLGTG